MSLVKSFELAFKYDDVLAKVLPILKFINQTIPFPQKHSLIHEPKIVRYLLELHSMIPDTIDMILNSLLNIFKHSKEWIDGCCKSIEEYAQLTVIGNGKMVALEFFETVLIEIADLEQYSYLLSYDIDDKCYAFIIFLQHADNEKLVREVMKRVREIQNLLGHRMKSANQLNQLVEETVLKLYHEEIQKNSDEFHYQTVAIELQEKENQTRKNSKPKMSLMAMNILSSQNLTQPKVSSKQQIPKDNNSFSADSIKGDELNVDEILLQIKPRIDSEQSEYFSDIDALQNLFAFITNPIAVEPSLVYAGDSLANEIKCQCEDTQYKLTVIKPDKLTTLRSFKTMIFLTDFHNHKLLMQANQHMMQVAFRSISGFFQNASSSGNLTHIIGLLQFYLRFELKETIYNFLYFQFHIMLLDYLYNPHYLDFLMRLIDPHYHKIPRDINNFIWQFLNKQCYVTYIVNKITNKEKEGTFIKRKDISKDSYQYLKNINDYKLQQLEDDDQTAVIYSTSSNMDQFLGPLVPGKTVHQNKQVLSRKMLLSLQIRRTSEMHSLSRQINKFIVQEYIELSELNSQGRDIDRLVDVVNYYKEINTPAETPTLINMMKQGQDQFEKRNQRTQVTEPPQYVQQQQNLPKLPVLGCQPYSTLVTDLMSSQRQKKSITLTENILIPMTNKKQEFTTSLIGINDVQFQTYRQNNQLKTPNSTARLLVTYYPNSDNSVVDTIMKEEYSKYEEQNDEKVAFYNSHLLKLIIESVQQMEFHYAFDELLDDQYGLLEKLLGHYTLTQISLFENAYESNSSNECQIILIELLNRINKKPINEKLGKIYLTYLPRLCRNLTILSRLCDEKGQKQQFFSAEKYLGIVRINCAKIIDIILRSFKTKNHRIYLKLNDLATFILNKQFHQYNTNLFYQQTFYSIMKQICLFAQDKQVLALLFKANLIEGISQAFQKCVVNKVIVKDQNIESFLIYLAQLSQLIILIHDLREDLYQYKSSLQRLQCYYKLKEIFEMYKNNKIMQQQAQEVQKTFAKKK